MLRYAPPLKVVHSAAQEHVPVTAAALAIAGEQVAVAAADAALDIAPLRGPDTPRASSGPARSGRCICPRGSPSLPRMGSVLWAAPARQRTGWQSGWKALLAHHFPGLSRKNTAVTGRVRAVDRVGSSGRRGRPTYCSRTGWLLGLPAAQLKPLAAPYTVPGCRDSRGSPGEVRRGFVDSLAWTEPCGLWVRNSLRPADG